MNVVGRIRKHLVVIGASMAGGALAGGAIVFAFTAVSPHLPTNDSRVAAVTSPSPSDLPTDDPSPSDSPSPAAPSPTPTAQPTQAPTSAPAPPPQAPAPKPSPTCPNGKILLAESGSGRWDGTFTVPALCAAYTFRWTFGPAPSSCTTWTLGFYADVNDQGHEYTQTGPGSGGGSQTLRNPGGRIQSEVNLYNGCSAIPWSIQATAG